ncbi:hypothetical protein ABZ137_21685 [Streptomyces bobili]|uniref:hypothetical protein n=1 Tax=Streptomyces bobili TaxID=67280 RepID=UPI0033B8DC61
MFLVEPTSRPDGEVRGCPFHNAVVEAAGTTPEVAELVEQHKREFTRRLAEVAAEAGARAPETLARQLALLCEGTRAPSTSLNDTQPAHDAHELAKTLIDQAITPARESSPATAP